MRVDELIRRLEQCPQTATVVVADWSEEYAESTPLTTVSISKDKRRVTLEEHEG